MIVAITVLLALTLTMAIYVWHLQNREIAASPPVGAVEHAAPPAAGPRESVTVYVAFDDPGELRTQVVSIPLTSGRQEKAEAVLHALMSIYTARNSPHLLAAGADVSDLFLVDPGLAIVDLNSEFAEGQVSGIVSEELTIVSLVQTLAANVPGLARVKFLVSGKERETLAGHEDLSGFYEVSQVSELATELSPQ